MCARGAVCECTCTCMRPLARALHAQACWHNRALRNKTGTDAHACLQWPHARTQNTHLHMRELCPVARAGARPRAQTCACALASMRMCMLACTCLHAHSPTPTCTHAHALTHTGAFTQAHACMHPHTRTCIRARTYLHACTQSCTHAACKHACTQAPRHACMHARTSACWNDLNACRRVSTLSMCTCLGQCTYRSDIGRKER